MAVAQWNVELFGNLRARCDDRVVSRFKTYKTGALFGYLAAQGANRQHRRDELIEMLWPESGGESGRNRLRMALCFLREDFDLPGQEEVIIANRSVVYLNPEAIRTDKAEFETLFKQGLAAESEEEQVAALEKAVEQYGGELMPEFDEEWLLGERHRLADSYITGLKRLIKHHSQASQFETALDYARRALETDPYREESHRTLIRLYGLMRRPAAALQQFRELERLLKEDLKIAPSAATKELLAQVTKGVEPSDTPSVAVVSAKLSYTPPASLTPETVQDPPALYTPITRLFGREDDIAQILAMLETPDTRLVTITGLGGMGKTRLALAVAERLHTRYPEAVINVSLAHLNEAERIPEEIARTMGLPRAARTTPLQQVIAALSKQPSLLTLDNMEHLAEEGGRVILNLLERTPSLQCLTTSRHRLGVAGEYEYALRPLPVPLLKGTPEQLREFASVQMFIDRATASYPEFVFDEYEADHVAALCRHLDGLPLAIELAAAWEQTMTTRQILARLTPRFGLLIKREKGGPTRHASLRATLDWSYNLLSPEAQRMLARLSVFRGGWTLEAAEAICADREEANLIPPTAVLELLTQLRERSLIVARRDGEERRFSMLEMVREYADEQLEGEERTRVEQRHAAYFSKMAQEAEPKLRGADAPT